jgi:hypothetical protein
LDLRRLKAELISLFEYLCSIEGRTQDNCTAVDAFFTTDDLWVRKELPEDFHEVFAYASEALHDTVSNPAVSGNFGCTPEQLLGKTRELSTEPWD